MAIDINRYRTADNFEYRVLAEDLPGQYPIAIFCDGDIRRLNANYECGENTAYSLVEAPRQHTRYFNVYRAADGAFVLGSRAFTSNEQRMQAADTARAISALCITMNNRVLINAYTVDQTND